MGGSVGGHDQSVAARQGGGRPRRDRGAHLRDRRRPGVGRGGAPPSRGHARRGPRAGRSAPSCGGQGPLQRRRAVGHARPHRRGHPGEHDAGVLRRPGGAGALPRRGPPTCRASWAGWTTSRSTPPRCWPRSSRPWTAARRQVLAASLRHPMHAVTAARLGCEVSTVPGKVLRQMLQHPLTTSGIPSGSRPTGALAPGVRRLAESAGRGRSLGSPLPFRPLIEEHSPRAPSSAVPSWKRARSPTFTPSPPSSVSRAFGPCARPI